MRRWVVALPQAKTASRSQRRSLRRASGTPRNLAAAIGGGVPVNLIAASGDSLLMLAAYRDHPGTVRMLLEHGPRPPQRSRPDGAQSRGSDAFMDRVGPARKATGAWMRDPLAVPDGELVTHSPRAPVLSKRYQTAHRLSLDVRMDRAPPGGASCGQRGEQRSRNERHATLPWRPLLVPAGGSGSASATALVPAESRFRREGAVLSCASARTARIGDAVYRDVYWTMIVVVTWR